MRHRFRSLFFSDGRPRFACHAVGVTLVLLGCSGEAHQRMMHILFEYPQNSEPPSTTSAERPHPISAYVESSAARGRLLSRHEPFVTRQCQTCHARNQSQLPRSDFLTNCRDCHKNYFSSTRYAHGPFASRDCLACHDMHVSQHDSLLVAPQQTLCTNCHAAQYSDVALTSYHRNLSKSACMDCHDPHSANNPLLLKKAALRDYQSAKTEEPRSD
jgi:predicted CXXCH cytochrome family protein